MFYPNFLYILREIVLGEFEVYKDPDCDRCPGNITRKVDKSNFIVHENWNWTKNSEINAGTFRSDIALIRLNEPVPLHSENSTISLASPVCLPYTWSAEDRARNLKDGKRTLVSGWGKTYNEQGKGEIIPVFSVKLKQVFLPIANNLCTEGNYKIDSTQLCAGGKKGA